MRIVWAALLIALIAAIAGISYSAGKRARPPDSCMKPIFASSHKLQSAMNVGVTKIDYERYLTEFRANVTMAVATTGISPADFEDYVPPSALPPELRGPSESTLEKRVVLCYVKAEAEARKVLELWNTGNDGLEKAAAQLERCDQKALSAGI